MLRLVLLAIAVATFTLQAEAFVNHGRAATRPVPGVLKFAPLFAKKKKDFKAPAPPSKAEKQGREDRFDAM